MNYEEFLDSAGIGPAQTEGQGQSQAGKVEGDLWKSAAKEKWPLPLLWLDSGAFDWCLGARVQTGLIIRAGRMSFGCELFK
jgi:hypothetical protein